MGAGTVFQRFHAEAARVPERVSTEEEGVIEVASADVKEVSELTKPESTRHDKSLPQRLLVDPDRVALRGRGTWVPKAAGVWVTPPSPLRPKPAPVDLVPKDPLAPRPTVANGGHAGSDADGFPLVRTSLQRARAKTVAARPRQPTLRPRHARRLFKSAVDQYKRGLIFDARADALLAQVYDPANPVYARTVERWEKEIARALEP